ncbi:MAG: acyl-CoA thioesterase [Planctomycetes bacterium]|nr:acyl-CoA thioesterase [Planctomycetota bacterium]MCK5473469.1 acyl-CoA thioesterase [Planctomycetota bacterium]
MENHKLVLPEHLNHYGYLFGGYLLKWVDEYAWIAATLDFPGHNFVTIGLDKVEFKKSVRQGAILRFLVERTKKGDTSVEYKVNVFCGRGEKGKQDLIFSTNVTFVNVDEHGGKKQLLA